MLNWEKKQRLFKLAYLVFLLFLSVFWYFKMGKPFHVIVLMPFLILNASDRVCLICDCRMIYYALEDDE